MNALNKENIQGPTGNGWTHSTIIGNRKRGTGILNNQLYIGKRIWNRLTYRRNPTTHKRVSQLNPEAEWIITDVPELRIINDKLWTEARTVLVSRSKNTRPSRTRHPYWRDRRPKHLLSGLIKCGACGGGMSLVSEKYYGCSTNRNKGTCSNRLTIKLTRLEEAVLHGLQEQLLTPELTEEFVQEYIREFNRIKCEISAEYSQAKDKQKLLARKIGNIVEAVADGRANAALFDDLDRLEEEKNNLDAVLAKPTPDPVRMHPNLADLYNQKVKNLRSTLRQDECREEAINVLRTLIDEIRLHPEDGQLQIELVGDLATLLSFANSKNPRKSGESNSAEWLVAGARNHLYRTKEKSKSYEGCFNDIV